MLSFVGRRVLQAVPLFAGVVVLVFVLLQLTPGDPLQAMVGAYPVPDEFRAELSAQFHLNDPLWTQFYYYVTNLLQGNLGHSFAAHESVLALILERLPNTLLLTGSGYLVGIVIGLIVGLIAAMTRRRALDSGLSVAVLVAYAIPSFWLGQLLVMFLAVKLGWFPTQGMEPLASTSTGPAWYWERLQYLALPMLTYAAYEGARVMRITRISVIETMRQDYITTARLKGVRPRDIIRKHVLRNSLLPVLTLTGYSFAVSMGGSVLIETVFSWPGLGLLFIESIRNRDNQVVLGIVLFIAVMVIVFNILVDVINAWLDPRIRRA